MPQGERREQRRVFEFVHPGGNVVAECPGAGRGGCERVERCWLGGLISVQSDPIEPMDTARRGAAATTESVETSAANFPTPIE